MLTYFLFKIVIIYCSDIFYYTAHYIILLSIYYIGYYSLNNWRVTLRHLGLYNDETIGIHCTHASVCKAPSPGRSLTSSVTTNVSITWIDEKQQKITKLNSGMSCKYCAFVATNSLPICVDGAWSNHSFYDYGTNFDMGSESVGDLWDFSEFLSTVFQLAIFLWNGIPFVMLLFVVDLFMTVNELDRGGSGRGRSLRSVGWSPHMIALSFEL